MTSAALAATSSQTIIGQHGWHLLMAAAWVAAFGGTVLVQRFRQRSGARRAAADTHRRRSTRRAEPWLQGAAVASVSAALVHSAVMPDHFSESVLYGLFFLGAALGQLAFAVGILVRPRRSLLLAGAAGSAALIGLWLVTRVAGIPLGPGQGETEPFGLLDGVAVAAEAATAVCCLVAARATVSASSWRWSRWPTALRLAGPTCLAVTVVVSALAPRS